jgi:hypothetical protein
MLDKTSNKTLEVILGIIILAILALVFFVVSGLWKTSKITNVFNKNVQTIESGFVDSRNAYDLAVNRAKDWKPDAVLSNLESGSVDFGGRSNNWTFIFASGSTKGLGFEIKVENEKIVGAKEIPYVSQGTALPSNLISADEAIQIAKSMPGNDKIEVTGVEAIYSPEGNIWYWGVKTVKGVITVKAVK